MKKISMFMLGAMALTFAACEDGPSVIPVESTPQAPVFTDGQYTFSQAGPLSSIGAGVLDLADYETNDLEIATINSYDESVGGTPTFKFEYSSTASFAKNTDDVTYTLELPVTVSDNKAYVSGEDLIDAHRTIFGKNPEPKTVYYRITPIVEKDGVDYQWGGSDVLVANDSYLESIPAVRPIDSAYYFLSDATGWDLAAPSKFTHSDADVYDDPIFTIKFKSANNNCYWKIAPQATVDLNDWNATFYGTEVDGNTDLTGILFEGSDGVVQAGCLAESATYTLTINMETLEYTFEQSSAGAGIYVRGGMNGWGCDKDWEFVVGSAAGTYVLNGVEIEAGVEFKFADENWGAINLGGDGTKPVFGTPYALVNAGDNISLASDFRGNITITETDGAYSVVFTEVRPGQPSGIYVRGGMNDWGTSSAWELLNGDEFNTWYINDVTIDQGVEFKLADANWGAVNLGCETAITFGEKIAMNPGGSNMSMPETATVDITLTLDDDTYYFQMDKK